MVLTKNTPLLQRMATTPNRRDDFRKVNNVSLYSIIIIFFFSYCSRLKSQASSSSRACDREAGIMAKHGPCGADATDLMARFLCFFILLRQTLLLFRPSGTAVHTFDRKSIRKTRRLKSLP